VEKILDGLIDYFFVGFADGVGITVEVDPGVGSGVGVGVT
jgi:hypothetical protein